MSDELNAMRIWSYQTSEDGDKTALNKIIDLITTLAPLALHANRTGEMRRRFLRMKVSGTDWELHAKKGGKSETSRQYVDSIFVLIRTLERHQEGTKLGNLLNDILYVEQKRYSKHPSSTENPSNITIAFKSNDDMPVRPHNRCSDC